MTDFPQNIRTFLFVPLFNVTVDASLFNKKINGFKIITSKQYFAEYKPLMIEDGWPKYTDELDKIVEIPSPGTFYHPLCNFLIVREIYLPAEENQQTADEVRSIINKYLERISYFLYACRCLKAGNLQYESYFAISKIAYYYGKLSYDTALQNMDRCKVSPLQKLYMHDWYDLSSNNVMWLLRFAKKIYKVKDKMGLPIAYFMEYYSSLKEYERIIKLAIVWESSILNDCKQELEYRFKIRSSALLEEDLSKVLSLAYDIRSSIVHTGLLRKENAKKLKKFLNTDETDGGTLLFIFMKDHLEEITRQILQNLILRIYKSGKTLEETAKDIDKEIFKSLGKI